MCILFDMSLYISTHTYIYIYIYIYIYVCVCVLYIIGHVNVYKNILYVLITLHINKLRYYQEDKQVKCG